MLCWGVTSRYVTTRHEGWGANRVTVAGASRHVPSQGSATPRTSRRHITRGRLEVGSGHVRGGRKFCSSVATSRPRAFAGDGPAWRRSAAAGGFGVAAREGLWPSLRLPPAAWLRVGAKVMLPRIASPNSNTRSLAGSVFDFWWLL